MASSLLVCVFFFRDFLQTAVRGVAVHIKSDDIDSKLVFPPRCNGPTNQRHSQIRCLQRRTSDASQKMTARRTGRETFKNAGTSAGGSKQGQREMGARRRDVESMYGDEAADQSITEAGTPIS